MCPKCSKLSCSQSSKLKEKHFLQKLIFCFIVINYLINGFAIMSFNINLNVKKASKVNAIILV